MGQRLAVARPPENGRFPPSMVAAKPESLDPGDAEPTKELTLADAPRGEGTGAVQQHASLAVAVFHASRSFDFNRWRTTGRTRSASGASASFVRKNMRRLRAAARTRQLTGQTLGRPATTPRDPRHARLLNLPEDHHVA